MKIVGWILVVWVSMMNLSVGFSVASPSVVLSRSSFLWSFLFSMISVAVLLWVLPKLTKLVAVLLMGFFFMCLFEGWGHEVNRFSMGQGGGWLDGIGISDVLTLFVPILPLLCFQAGDRLRTNGALND